MTRVLGPDSIQIVERSQLPLVADPAPTVTENTGTTRTVVLRPEARHTIRNLDLTTEWESGGWLVGWQDGDELIVETVYAAKGSDHRGEKNAVSLDGEWFAVVDEKAQRCGWRVVGDWHSHPQSDTEPSARDEHGWLQQTVRLRQVYVGIILCPTRTRTQTGSHGRKGRVTSRPKPGHSGRSPPLRAGRRLMATTKLRNDELCRKTMDRSHGTDPRSP